MGNSSRYRRFGRKQTDAGGGGGPTSVGPNDPASATDGGGPIPWSNPENITTHAGNATASLMFGSTSNGLIAEQYGLGIPNGATITGIQVQISRESPNGTIRDFTIQLRIGGTTTGDNKADFATNWPTTQESAVYGGPGDLWGLTPTVGDLNADNFGVSLSVQAPVNEPLNQAGVGSVQVTVYYTP